MQHHRWPQTTCLCLAFFVFNILVKLIQLVFFIFSLSLFTHNITTRGELSFAASISLLEAVRHIRLWDLFRAEVGFNAHGIPRSCKWCNICYDLLLLACISRYIWLSSTSFSTLNILHVYRASFSNSLEWSYFLGHQVFRVATVLRTWRCRYFPFVTTLNRC